MEYTLESADSLRKSGLLKLLNSDRSVIVFLHKVFVEDGRESISESELVKLWEMFQLVHLGFQSTGDNLSCVKSWLDERHMWLENMVGDDGVVYYQLSFIAENAFNVYEMVTDSSSSYRSLGTESSYSHMVAAVRDLARRMDMNRNHQIQYHKERIRYHTKMLQNLQAGGEIEVVDKADFIKNLQFIINILRQNPADFRALASVYRNFFQEMIDYIYQAVPGKGTLLDYFTKRSAEIDEDLVGKIYRSFIEISFDGSNEEIFKALRLFERSSFYSEEMFPDRPTILFSKLRMTVSIVNDEIKKIIKHIHAYCSSRDVKKDRETRDAIAKSLSILEKFFNEKDLPALEHREPKLKLSCPLSNRLNFETSMRAGGLRIAGSPSGDAKPVAPELNIDFIDYRKLRRQLLAMTKGGKKVLLSELVLAYPPVKGIQEVLGYLLFTDDFKFTVLHGVSCKFNFVMPDTGVRYQDLTFDVEFERRKV